MENLEVILMNVRKELVDSIIFNVLSINPSDVKSSYFFDRQTGTDLEYENIVSFSNIFTPHGTGNIVLDKLNLGQWIENVVIVLSFDEEYGDIVFNFPEGEVFKDDNDQTKDKLIKMLNYLMVLKNKYDIESVRFGLEPATDEDTCLIELKKDNYDLEKEVLKLLK